MTACKICQSPLQLTDALPPGVHARCAISKSIKRRLTIQMVGPDGAEIQPQETETTMEPKARNSELIDADATNATSPLASMPPTQAPPNGPAGVNSKPPRTITVVAAELEETVRKSLLVKPLSDELQRLLGKRTRARKDNGT